MTEPKLEIEIVERVYREARLQILENPNFSSNPDSPLWRNTVETCKDLADQGYGKAYFLLYWVYIGKQGDECDELEGRRYADLSMQWSLRNRETDDVEIWSDLGELYMELGDIYMEPSDYDQFSKAVHWFRKAAEYGYAYAQNQLSHCYMFGLGVPEDLQQAEKWSMAAALQGDKIGKANVLNMEIEREWQEGFLKKLRESEAQLD